ncbi:MAG: DUF2802 domain-containing protein [Pseudomonas sp.]|jgi:hypothetical protein|nr:DUF2802 domain-containing protein [Pseudomonas sp.]
MLYLVLFLSLLCIGNCIALYRLWRKKQHSDELYAKQIEQQNQAFKGLNRRVEIYLSGSMRMGEELHELQKQQKDLAPLSEKILRMEQRDLGSLSFTQAARLIGLGASTEDIKQSCGLSQSEAELVQRLHKKNQTL